MIDLPVARVALSERTQRSSASSRAMSRGRGTLSRYGSPRASVGTSGRAISQPVAPATTAGAGSDGCHDLSW